MSTKKLGSEEAEPEERYWCPYCGRPLNPDRDFVRGWYFHSPRGGAYFHAKIYKCHRCKKKVRITIKEPGIPLKEESY